MDKKIQVKRKVIGTEYVNEAGETVNERDENVYPVISSDHVIMEDGSKLTDKLLNINGEDYSKVITQEYAVDRVGGNDYKDQSKSGKLADVKLYGKTIVNELGDHGTSPITTNGNDVFAPNEGMNEKVRVIDGQMDELTIKGNSTYNIMPDRTCCTDDVEISGDNTKAFSFKDGLDSRIMLDTGLSDKMVLKGNTLTNIVRDPVGYASVHEVQDNIVPGSNENVRVLRNIADKYRDSGLEYNGNLASITTTASNNTGFTEFLGIHRSLLKHNTKYTLVMDIIENTLDTTLSNNESLKIQLGYGGTNFFTIPNGTIGRYVSTITSYSGDWNSHIAVISRSGSTIGTKCTIKNFMIIEGDCSDIAANLPYFKGTLSVNMENYDESRPKLVSGDCDRTKIYGQTLVDVLGSNRNSTERNLIKTSDWSTGFATFVENVPTSNAIIKPGTLYMMRFKVSNLNLNGSASIELAFVLQNGTYDNDLFTRDINSESSKIIKSNGVYYVKLKTVNTIPEYSKVFCKILNANDDSSLTISEVSMYEYQEGMENWDLPYMVGEMRGTGLAKIESIVNGGEKELVDVLGEARMTTSKTFTANTAAERTMVVLPKSYAVQNLKVSTDYIMRFKISNLNLDGDSRTPIYLAKDTSNSKTNYFSSQSTDYITENGIYTVKLTTIDDFSSITTDLIIKGGKNAWEDSNSTSRTLTISEVSLYEYTPDMDDMELPYMLGTKRIGYYGERKRTYTLPSGLELRSLPNGVRDEFDFESGILTRRVGTDILDGVTGTYRMGVDPSALRPYIFKLYDQAVFAESKIIIADRVIVVSEPNSIEKPRECISKTGYDFGARELAYYPPVGITERDEILSYLEAHPIKVQYELATPQYIDYSKDILEDGEYKVGERINGFQDGYNPTTGKYIKRIETVTFNGSEGNWNIETQLRVYPEYLTFMNKLSKMPRMVNTEINFKCNNQYLKEMARSSSDGNYNVHNNLYEGSWLSYGDCIVFRIHQSRLFENSLAGFKDYLSRNPITVSYVLADEIESNMTQEEFNALTNRANPKLHYFKDGSLKCTCLSGQPKGQLRINTPTSNYYDMQLIKPNTQYTVNNFSNMYIDGTKYQTSSAMPNQLTTPNKITSKKIVINTNTDSVYPMMVRGVHDVNDIRFFGMKSSTVLMNTRGKNLFNKDAVIEGKYQNYNIAIQNFEITDIARYAITEYIPIKPNTTYIKSGTSGGAYYDINKNVIKTDRIIGNTFTTPSNARYIILNSLDSSSETPVWGDNAYIMEASESDTTYEPYAQPHEFKAFTKDENGVLQAVELNRINDNLCDEIDLSTGIITRRVNKVNLSKLNYAWNYYNYYHDTFITFTIHSPIFGRNKNPKSHGNCIIDNKSSTGILNISCGWNGEPPVDIHKLSLIKDRPFEFFKENNVYFIYELAKPYTEQAYIMIDGEFKTSLMLPNGVADGYNPITKVKTTRVGIETLDGNYNGNYTISNTTETAVEVRLNYIPGTAKFNNYNWYSKSLRIMNGGMNFNKLSASDGIIWLNYNKEKIGTNKATLLQYLKDNPITVYYQKAEKITETLDTFDTSTVVNNFPLANEYGYKVENTNEIKLSKVIHHLPTANMLYVPLLEPNMQYKIPSNQNFILDGNSLGHLNQIVTMPSSINNKKLILIGKFSPSIHSLIKYTGYTPNLSRLYQGHMRSDAISSSKNPKVTGWYINRFNPNECELLYPETGNQNFAKSITVNGDYITFSGTSSIGSNQMVIRIKNKYGITNSNQIQITGTFITNNETKDFAESLSSGKDKIQVNGSIIHINFTYNWQSITEATLRIMITDSMNTQNLEFVPYKQHYECNYTIQKALSITSGSIDPSGNEIESADMSRSDFIKVIPGLMYYLYNNTTQKIFNIVKYNSDKTCFGKDVDNGTCRYLVPSSVSYIRVVTSTLDSDNLVIKADLPLHRINADIYDEIDVKHNKLIRRVGRMTDLWKCNMTVQDNSASNIPQLSIAYATNGISNINGVNASINILSNNLNTVGGLDANMYAIKMQANNFVLRLDGSQTTEEEFKNWFRANPTDILYELATPEVYDLRDYTDLVNPLPNVYKDGTIQLESSSETYPIIDYRTRSSNYFRSNLITSGYNYRLKASIATNPVAMISDKFNETEFDGDMVITANNTTPTDNYILFDTDKIDDVMLVPRSKADDTLVYTSGLSSVKVPVIKCIGNNLFDGKFEGFEYNTYYTKSLNLKPHTNYVIKTTLTGSTSATEGTWAMGLWKYNNYATSDYYITYMIYTNGNIGDNGYKVFNTEDYDIKLAVFLGTREYTTDKQLQERYQTLMDNYKIELYEVGNDTTNLYKENVTRILDKETKEEIELNSTSDNTTERSDVIDLTNNIVTIRNAKITITSMEQIENIWLAKNHIAGTDENAVNAAGTCLIFHITPSSQLMTHNCVSGYYDINHWNNYDYINLKCNRLKRSAAFEVVSTHNSYFIGCNSDRMFTCSLPYPKYKTLDDCKQWIKDNLPLEIVYNIEPYTKEVIVLGTPIAYSHGNIRLESEEQIPKLEYKSVISTNQEVISTTNEINRQDTELQSLLNTLIPPSTPTTEDESEQS